MSCRASRLLPLALAMLLIATLTAAVSAPIRAEAMSRAGSTAAVEQASTISRPTYRRCLKRAIKKLSRSTARTPTLQQRRRVKVRCKRIATTVVTVATTPGPTVPPPVTPATGDEPTVPPATGGTPPMSAASTPMQPAGGIFGPQSEFARDITDAPLAADSDALVANLGQQVAEYYDGIAAFNKDQFNVSAFMVSAGQPRANVIWDNCQRKSSVPKQLYDPSRGAIFASVPIPEDAVPAKGSDGELSIYDSSTDQLWEFWRANKQADGWHACWGGRIDQVATSKGFFADGTGASASGLSATAGSIRIREAQALKIDHAMSLGITRIAHWSEFSYPAQRSDGSEPVGKAAAIREGQRFRLDPSLDVNTLRLHPVAAAMARAAQQYGFIVTDRSGGVSVNPESGIGTTSRGAANPWAAILGSTPSYQVLRNFPWNRMQALPIDYGK